MGDSDIAKLCRQIYQKHKQALELIYEHRPDPQGATREILVDLIRNTEGLSYKGRYRSTYVYILPNEWDVPALNIGSDSHGFLRFVFHNHSGELVLFLETSRGDEGARRRMFEMGLRDESLFNHLVDPATDQYPKLYRRIFLTPEFYEEATDDDREKENRRCWDGFLDEDLPRIDTVLKGEEWIWEPVDDHSP